MKNSKKMKFIFTCDESIKDELKIDGFTLISEENGKYTFLNNGILKFDKDEDKDKLIKMCYTNLLCI